MSSLVGGRVFTSLLTQVRGKKNFFTCRRQDELWKTITSVSNAGKKKGRASQRQRIRPLHPFYHIGRSPLMLHYPGLNTRLTQSNVHQPISLTEQKPEEIVSLEQHVHQAMGTVGKVKRRRKNEKLNALERGFHGPYIMGQKLGPPPPQDGVSFDDYESCCLEIKKICEMKGGLGRVHTMKVLVMVGNGKGSVGYGIGWAPIFQTNDALVRAISAASRRLIYVELLEGRTIYQDFFGECNYTRVLAFRKQPGYGLVCHPRIKKICELIGIKDIYVKVEGSTNNYYALVKAFLTGLLHQETYQQLAERTRLHVVELDAERQYYPRVVASPQLSQVKGENEVELIERLKLDDYYGAGRITKRLPADDPPFYRNTPHHLYAQWKMWVFRNQEQQKIRLLADGEMKRDSIQAKKEWSKRLTAEVFSGEKPVPHGIGLPDVIERPEGSG